jgi:hypothetical protein
VEQVEQVVEAMVLDCLTMLQMEPPILEAAVAVEMTSETVVRVALA